MPIRTIRGSAPGSWQKVREGISVLPIKKSVRNSFVNNKQIPKNHATVASFCTGAPLVMCCDWLDHGSRQVKHDLVD